MERLKFSRTKRRSGNEKCSSSVRLARLCEEHGENNDKYQASPRPFHGKGLARPASTSQGPSDFGDRRRYADLGDLRGNLHGRPIHSRRAGCTANPSMSGAKCAVLQRLAAASRAKKAAASP